MEVLRYKYSKDVSHLKKAVPLLQESLQSYKRLTKLTKDTYRYSGSLQISARKIPFDGSKFIHWTDCLPVYEKEFEDFRKKVKQLTAFKENDTSGREALSPQTLPAIDFQLLNNGMEVYEIKQKSKIFSDQDYVIEDVAPELQGLKGIRFSLDIAKNQGAKITFEVNKPLKVLVGYFQDRDLSTWLQLPDLEIDVTNPIIELGGLDPVLLNAVAIPGLPTVNIHVLSYSAGKHVMDLGKGGFLILGFVDADAKILPRDANITPRTTDPLNMLLN
jgi:hypothetical protein